MTKKQSTMLQGLAALFLLYHHFFMEPNNLIEFLSFYSVNATRSAAWFCKICVGIFSFVSGYGMFIVAARYDSKKMPFFERLIALYKGCFIRVFKLYSLMWFVIIVFKAIDVIFMHQTIEPFEFLLNMLAVSTTYNGAMWYVFEYFWMMLLLPVLDCFFNRFDKEENRKKWIFYVTAGVVSLALVIVAVKVSPLLLSILLWIKLYAKPMYLLVFVVGYLVSRFKVFDQLEKALDVFQAGAVKRVARLILALLLLFAVVCIRVKLATDMNYIKTDFILVPVFAWAVINLLEDENILSKGMAFLLQKTGSISTYLWFIHVFMFSLTYWWLLPIIKSPVVFYLSELIMTIAASLILMKIKEGFTCLILKIKKK